MDAVRATTTTNTRSKNSSVQVVRRSPGSGSAVRKTGERINPDVT